MKLLDSLDILKDGHGLKIKNIIFFAYKLDYLNDHLILTVNSDDYVFNCNYPYGVFYLSYLTQDKMEVIDKKDLKKILEIALIKSDEKDITGYSQLNINFNKKLITDSDFEACLNNVKKISHNFNKNDSFYGYAIDVYCNIHIVSTFPQSLLYLKKFLTNEELLNYSFDNNLNDNIIFIYNKLYKKGWMRLRFYDKEKLHFNIDSVNNMSKNNIKLICNSLYDTYNLITTYELQKINMNLLNDILPFYDMYQKKYRKKIYRFPHGKDDYENKLNIINNDTIVCIETQDNKKYLFNIKDIIDDRKSFFNT